MKNDDYVIPFGYNKGKQFKDVSLKQLDSLVAWIENQKLQDRFKDLYDAVVEYLEANHYADDSEDT